MTARKPVETITDRAKRYRANADHRKKTRCECTDRQHDHGAVCGSRRFLVIGHRDGNESNGAKANLFTQCKSCNTKDGKRDARLGRGVRTRQYNPYMSEAFDKGSYRVVVWANTEAGPWHVQPYVNNGETWVSERGKYKRRELAVKKAKAWLNDQTGTGPIRTVSNPGALNLAQYVQAAVEHTRGAHDEGGRVIHETPKAKRKEFAREIAFRKGHRNPGFHPGLLTGRQQRARYGRVPYNRKAAAMVRRARGKGAKASSGGVLNEVIDALVGQGYKKLEAVKRAKAATGSDFSSLFRSALKNPSDRIFEEWKAGRLRTAAGDLVPRGGRGEKQARAILLSELRKEGKIPAKMNPGGATADELYSIFHGRGPDESYSVNAPQVDLYGAHPEIAQLGLLTRLMVGEGVVKLGGDYGDEVLEGEDGAFCNTIEFVPYQKYMTWLEDEPDVHKVRDYLRKHGAPDLAADPNGSRQLYIVGGNQDIDGMLEKLGADPSKDICDLGECYLVDYFTQKRFDRFEPTNYYHALGEKTGVRPRLLYFRQQKLLGFAGGEYFVTRRGIEN